MVFLSAELLHITKSKSKNYSIRQNKTTWSLAKLTKTKVKHQIKIKKNLKINYNNFDSQWKTTVYLQLYATYSFMLLTEHQTV